MFKKLTHISLFFFILLVFSSCGKDSGSNPQKNNASSADVSEVKLTSAKTISIYENQASVTTLFARSKNDITYSISGGDSKDFVLNSKSGVITFKSAPDYESKKSYTFKATAIDDAGNNDVENISINILDINENEVSTNDVKRIFFISKIPLDGDNTPDTPAVRPVPPVDLNPTPDEPDNNPIIEEELEEELDKTYRRINSANVVLDNTTRMMWQDDNDAKTLRMNWDNANIHCENVTLAGYLDWRLPSVTELHSIVDNKRSNKAASPVFRNLVARNYWLSTKYFPNSDNAWTINLYHGNSYGSYKSSRYYAVCVRDY